MLSYLLLPLICTSILVVRIVEKDTLKFIGLTFNIYVLKKLFIGLATGFVMISSVFIIGYAMGFFRVVGYSSAGDQVTWLFFLFLIGFFGTAIYEEILYRGYVFQKLINGSGMIPAVLIISSIFALNHYNTPHFTMVSLLNLVFLGILLGLIKIRTNSL